MKGNDDHIDDRTTAGHEQRCRAAGDVIERALPQAQPTLDAAQWDRLREALAARPDVPRRARRRRVLIAALATCVAGAGAALFLLRARPITVVEQGAGALRFSDGSRVALAGASLGRVVARTPDGATFSVDRGRARFDVVHRAHTRWTVTAGPFEVLVTGTSFDVDWSGSRARTLAVELHAGAVTVRGGLAGAGVSLRAGQRLVADVDRGRLTVGDGDAHTPATPGASAGAGDPGSSGAAPPDVDIGATEPAQPVGASDDDRGDRARAGLANPSGLARTAGSVAPSSGQVILQDPRAGAAAPSQTVAVHDAPGPSGALGLARAQSLQPPSTEPAPWPAPAPSPSPSHSSDGKVAAGGSACLGWSPQIRFDRGDGATRAARPLEGVEVASAMSLAFTRPVIDHARTWCGVGSLRVDARFDLVGAPNRLGHRPRHAGEVLIDLPEPVDLTGKTVTVHFFVEGPSDIRFAAQVFAIQGPASGDPRWVGGGFTPGLTTGRWWTLTHAFDRANRLFEGGTAPVDQVGRVSLQVYAIGQDRVWTGRVFIDDIGWQ